MYFCEFYLNFVYLYYFLQSKWDDEYKKITVPIVYK